MKLVVRIQCVDCKAWIDVHVLGGWDIENVHHQCEHDLGRQFADGRELADGDFVVTCDPPRGVS